MGIELLGQLKKGPWVTQVLLILVLKASADYQEEAHIIITHPQLAGCEDLLEQVAKVVQPKLHVFGHIHEGEAGTV